MGFQRLKEKIRIAEEVKPKVEPNYKKMPRSWTVMATAASVLGSIVLAVIMDQGPIAFVGATLLVAVSTFSGLFRGDYSLAVRFVNSTSVKEWSYNSGIAVIMLSNDNLAILDTTFKKKLYLSREYSVQRYPLLRGAKAKPRVKFIALVNPKTINLNGSLGFKRVKLLKGIVEVPSIKSENEVMRFFGAFLEASLSETCIRKASSCIEKLFELL